MGMLLLLSNSSQSEHSFTGDFTVSSVWASYSGHLAGGLRDSLLVGASSVWASQLSASEWIKADLGSVVLVNDVEIGSINIAFEGWGASFTNGRLLQISTDGSSWTTIATLADHYDDTINTYAINATARYVRISYSGAGGYLAVGEFRINYLA